MLHRKLKDKNIIVVGGSSGIGLAVARIAWELGANVCLTSRTQSNATSAANSLGLNATGLALDVDNENAVIAFFTTFKQIDHIYIAAGSIKFGNVVDGNLNDNLSAFNTRLLGSLRIVRAAASKMSAFGSITFTGGVISEKPIAGAWAESLGTSSVEQLARVLVLEFSNVRFNAVAPGYTDTPLLDRLMGDNKSTIVSGIAEKLPVKKIATSEEVASAVIFLMANESVTGEVIHIDGGSRLM